MAKAVWILEDVYRGFEICSLLGQEGLGYFVELDGDEFNFPDMDDARFFIDHEAYGYEEGCGYDN